ncbi:uncharacterized protein LOC117603836 isoform X3 [Osmia lignaria lignaria]|uniref:uncharacterized protein LOC117603836 isoform X3 n=1 Tax=Osmia lignaria lignaria TaxID=1437193 RepID=UPI00402BC04E
MQNSTHRRLSTKEAYKIFDEILEEDREEDEDEDRSEDCPADCAEDVLPVVEKKFCECIRIAENSSRFSLRVMEAMRSLQNDEDDFLPTSSIDDIVDYIQKNYRDDGDLYAQGSKKKSCSTAAVIV